MLSFGSVIMGVIMKIRIFVLYPFGIQGGSETPRAVLKNSCSEKSRKIHEKKFLIDFFLLNVQK